MSGKFLGLISYGWWQLAGDVTIQVNPSKDIEARVEDGQAIQGLFTDPPAVEASVGAPTPLEALLARTELSAIVQKGSELQATVVSKKALAAHLEWNKD